jgi:hypothetical protein
VTGCEFSRLLSLRFAPPQKRTRLLRRLRFVKARLATVRRIAMNDAALRRFVDRRNRRANLIGTERWRGADLFLQRTQIRLNAAIVGCAFKGLSGTFSG